MLKLINVTVIITLVSTAFGFLGVIGTEIFTRNILPLQSHVVMAVLALLGVFGSLRLMKWHPDAPLTLSVFYLLQIISIWTPSFYYDIFIGFVLYLGINVQGMTFNINLFALAMFILVMMVRKHMVKNRYIKPETELA